MAVSDNRPDSSDANSSNWEMLSSTSDKIPPRALRLQCFRAAAQLRIIINYKLVWLFRSFLHNPISIRRAKPAPVTSHRRSVSGGEVN